MESDGVSDMDCVVTSTNAGAPGGCQDSVVSELRVKAVSCAIPAGRSLPVNDYVPRSLRSSDGAAALYVSHKTNGNGACGLHAPFGSLKIMNSNLMMDEGSQQIRYGYKQPTTHVSTFFKLLP